MSSGTASTRSGATAGQYADPVARWTQAGWQIIAKLREWQETDSEGAGASMGLFKRGGRGGPAGVQGGWNAAAGDQGGGWDAQPTLQDGFLPASVGIQTRGDVFTPLIAKGSLLPAARTEIFTTADPNQTAIKITAFQGEHGRATKNMALGVYEVTGIAPAKAGKPQINVTFQVDTDGLLSILATDRASGRALPVLRS